MQTATKNKLTFFALLALFLIPVLIAGTMFFTGRGIPQHTVNHGSLLQPPLPFAKLGVANFERDKWALVYINPLACEQTCLATLYKMRQTRTALGKNRDRLLRIFLTYKKPTPAIEQQLNIAYRGTQVYLVDPHVLTVFLHNTPQQQQTLQQGRLYLIDPLGNMLITYPLDVPFKALLSDLNRLLQISQIG